MLFQDLGSFVNWSSIQEILTKLIDFISKSTLVAIRRENKRKWKKRKFNQF